MFAVLCIKIFHRFFEHSMFTMVCRRNRLVGEPSPSRKAIADLLRKHGGKTGEELKAEGK